MSSDLRIEEKPIEVLDRDFDEDLSAHALLVVIRERERLLRRDRNEIRVEARVREILDNPLEDKGNEESF